MAGGTKCALQIPEVDQKMWPRRGKKTEEAEPVKEQRRGSCWWHAWEAVQLRARMEGLSRFRHKGARSPEAKPGESAGIGLISQSSSFQTCKDLLICECLLCARYKKGNHIFQQTIIQSPIMENKY